MTIPFTKFEGLYIGSGWVPVSGEREPVINPATEEVIGLAPVGGAKEADAAIAAARDAFDTGPWPRMSRKERAAYMQKMHAAFTARKDQMIALLIAEAGCSSLVTQLVQYQAPLDHMARAIDDSLRDDSIRIPLEATPSPVDPNAPKTLGSATVVREPIGVVSGITAYNFPFLLNMAKVAPALLAGNTLVLKPSPFTPFSALVFGEVAKEIGLPKGVLNVVTGGAEVGTMLSSDPRIDMVTFTGSEPVGIAISQQAAATLKRVHLELGGKSAYIVRGDADVQQAALEGLAAFTANCGQGCALLTRHLVHNSIKDAYVQTLNAASNHWKIGNPADPTVLMGPLIREAQRAKVERLVQSGKDAGAKLVRGGTRPKGFEKGFFYDVTIFDDVDNRWEIAQEEFFGPVACVIGFDTDEEAIRIANDSRFGLFGGIRTNDPAKAYEMALQIRTGGVSINGGMGKMPYVAFGGYKHSGLGREYGEGWLREFQLEKTISYPVGR